MKISPIQLFLFLLLLNTSCSSTKKGGIKGGLNASQVVQAFNNLPQKPVVFNIQKDTFTAPVGGHIQGIQQLDKKHLVISGSSNDKAYFFITKMKGITRVKRRGIITKMIYINNDFPSMRHNHASGFQLVDNLLAIGTEGGRDTNKSSVVFYDLTDPDNPKPLRLKIDRQEDTAGAIGLTSIGDSLLLAVGGWDSDRIDFYWAAANTTQLDFKLLDSWHTKNKNTTDWTDALWGSYQSLNFVKEEAANLYLVGFYQNVDGTMIADLYQVNLQQTPAKRLQKIASKRFATEAGVSFKNGAGLSLLNFPKRLNVLATERDWDLLIRVNYW